MPLRIDRVDTEIEIMRKEEDTGFEASLGRAASGNETLESVRGRKELRDRLRPIVLEILNDELMRINRKVGSP
jgi:hypothetical protein